MRVWKFKYVLPISPSVTPIWCDSFSRGSCLCFLFCFRWRDLTGHAWPFMHASFMLMPAFGPVTCECSCLHALPAHRNRGVHGSAFSAPLWACTSVCPGQVILPQAALNCTCQLSMKCGRWEGLIQHSITPNSPWHLTIPVIKAQTNSSTPHLPV